MMIESAIITEIHRDHCVLQYSRRSACGACQLEKGCGTAVLGRWLTSTQHLRYPLQHIPPTEQVILSTGRRVQLGLPATALVLGSLTVYGLPLLGILLGGLIMQGLSPYFDVVAHDGYLGLAMLLGGGLGFRLSQYLPMALPQWLESSD